MGVRKYTDSILFYSTNQDFVQLCEENKVKYSIIVWHVSGDQHPEQLSKRVQTVSVNNTATLTIFDVGKFNKKKI